MYVTCGEICTKITSDGAVDIDELRTTQEEADTRVIFHSKHASSCCTSIIIVAEDTDIIILCLAFQSRINCNLYIKCGSATHTRYIDITKVAKALGRSLCDALIGMHAYTGCDTISAFSGRGKPGALKILLSNIRFQQGFARLGKDWVLSTALLTILEEFTCCMYAAHTQITNVNEMRFQLFRSKNGDIQSGQMPPCKDCLEQHAIRASYQAAVWQHSLEACPEIPSPLDCDGWVLDDEGKLIRWMLGAPAHDVIMEFLSCKCKRVCSLPLCTCMSNGLKCTDACFLQECDNMTDEDQDELPLGGSSDDESDTDEF